MREKSNSLSKMGGKWDKNPKIFLKTRGLYLDETGGQTPLYPTPRPRVDDMQGFYTMTFKKKVQRRSHFGKEIKCGNENSSSEYLFFFKKKGRNKKKIYSAMNQRRVQDQNAPRRPARPRPRRPRPRARLRPLQPRPRQDRDSRLAAPVPLHGSRRQAGRAVRADDAASPEG